MLMQQQNAVMPAIGQHLAQSVAVMHENPGILEIPHNPLDLKHEIPHPFLGHLQRGKRNPTGHANQELQQGVQAPGHLTEL